MVAKHLGGAQSYGTHGDCNSLGKAGRRPNYDTRERSFPGEAQGFKPARPPPIP